MKRKYLIALSVVICFTLFGCNGNSEETIGVSESGSCRKETANDLEDKAFLDLCNDIYKDVCISERHSYEIEEIIRLLGNNGYIAVDAENRVNMTCSERVLNFIENQAKNEASSVQVIQILKDCGIWKFDLSTNEGTVKVIRTYYSFNNNHLKKEAICEFEAIDFKYTDEDYLIISGYWYSPELYALTLSDVEEHIAFRVGMLDDKCRSLCEKYIRPISYSHNNMFLTNWNQTDYGDLDLYDVFEKFYEKTYSKDFPYDLQNVCVGAEIQVQEKELEQVVMQHIPIAEQELHEKLRYDSPNACYIYRPRTFCEFDYCDVPYPEVVSFEENEDGTITLLVNAVFPDENTSKLFTHSVTVKEIDGKIQYLSNQIADNAELNLWWHGKRLTEEEWLEYYGEN